MAAETPDQKTEASWYDPLVTTAKGVLAGAAEKTDEYLNPKTVSARDTRPIDKYGRRIGKVGGPGDEPVVGYGSTNGSQLWYAWQNTHPISYSYHFLKSLVTLPADAPKIVEFANSLQRGSFLWDAQEKYNRWRRDNPREPDSKNPYNFIKSNDFFRDVYTKSSIASDAAIPFGMDAGPMIRGALFNQYYAKRDPKTGQLVYDNDAIQDQVFRDMYTAGVVGNSYSSVDEHGERKWDWGAVQNTLVTHPIDTILTFTPLIELRAAKGAGTTARLAAALDESTVAADAARAAKMADARARGVPLSEDAVRVTPDEVAAAAQTTRQKIARGVQIGTKAIEYGLNPAAPALGVVVPILARKGRQIAVRTGVYRPQVDIYNPEYTAALNAYKDAEASRLAQADIDRQYTQHGEEVPDGLFEEYKRDDLARLNHPDSQQQVISDFNEATGNRFANPYNEQTNAALRDAGINPANATSYGSRVALENAARNKGGIDASIANEAILRQQGIKATSSMATGQGPSRLFGKEREQAARENAAAKMAEERAGIFGPRLPQGATAAERAAAEQRLLTTAAEDLSRTVSSVAPRGGTRMAIPDGATHNFGGAEASYNGATGNWTLNGNNLPPEVQGAMNESWLSAHPSPRAQSPIVRKALGVVQATAENPALAVPSLESMLQKSAFGGAGGTLPPEVNLSQTYDILGPEAQEALRGYTRSRLSEGPVSDVATYSRANPWAFTPEEQGYLAAQGEARNIVGREVPKPNPSKLARLKSGLSWFGGPGMAGWYLSGNPFVGGLAALTGAGARYAYRKLGNIGFPDRMGAPVYINPDSIAAARFRPPPSATYIYPTMASQAADQPQPPSRAPQVQTAQQPASQAKVNTPVVEAPKAEPSKESEFGEFKFDPKELDQGYGGEFKFDPKELEAAEPQPQRRGGRVQRASGGQVMPKDLERLVSGLMIKAKKAKMAQAKSTEPMLDQHDDTIAKALNVAQKAI